MAEQYLNGALLLLYGALALVEQALKQAHTLFHRGGAACHHAAAVVANHRNRAVASGRRAVARDTGFAYTSLLIFLEKVISKSIANGYQLISIDALFFFFMINVLIGHTYSSGQF